MIVNREWMEKCEIEVPNVRKVERESELCGRYDAVDWLSNAAVQSISNYELL